MVTIGNVWDRTTDVLGERSGILAKIAAVFFLLPNVVQAAFSAYSTVGVLLSIIVSSVLVIALVLMFWGQLAMVAVSTYPSVNFTGGVSQGLRRLGALIAVYIGLVVVVSVIALPFVGALALNDIGLSSLTDRPLAGLAGKSGVALFAGFAVLNIVLLVLMARLMLINSVVLIERRSLDAIGRSFTLTRGLTWRLIGVTLLFAIVVLIATSAAQLVAGVVFRLILGDEGQATVQFLANVAGSIVTTIFTTVAVVFSAQLYVALAPATGAPEPA